MGITVATTWVYVDYVVCVECSGSVRCGGVASEDVGVQGGVCGLWVTIVMCWVKCISTVQRQLTSSVDILMQRPGDVH